MKKLSVLLTAGLVCMALLAACAASPASSQNSMVPAADEAAQLSETDPQQSSLPDESAPETEEELIYRGRVSEMGEGTILVEQLPGYNYGQPSIMFHVDENTAMGEGEPELGVDAFVEVSYSGILTRSLPAQGTALKVTVITSFSEGILVNGTIDEIEEIDGNYRITLLPFAAAQAAAESGVEPGFENMIILTVPTDALENIEAEELVPGAEVCAVTTGIAALSLPPQMPVRVLLPYSE